MAFDAVFGGDPRGPWCKGCKAPIENGQPTTEMRFPNDPDGKLGLSGLWHGECARPYWDSLTPVMKLLGKLGGGL